jgi:ABC-2 type transport system permease protein
MSGLIKNELLKLFHNRKVFFFMVIVLLANIVPVLMTLLVRIRTLDGQSYPSTLFGFTVSWILPLFLVVIITEMITEEYMGGTLSLSLVHPVSRFQLYTAKALSLLIFIAVAVLYSLLVGYGIGTIVFGWGTEFFMRGVAYTTWQGMQITVGSYLLSIIPLWSFCFFVMFLATVLSGGASVVGTAAGFMLIATILDVLSGQVRPYLITTYFTSLPVSVLIAPQQGGVTFALTFLFFHGVIFYLAGFYILHKRDLTN